VSTPSFDTVLKREVVKESNSGNPIIIDSDWDKRVVVIVEGEDISTGDEIKFVVKKEHNDHYQALLKGQSSISKPDYDSKPNIPLHHDGKHNQSVGDTRSEGHALRSPDDRY
jgi:hypothetical protein